MFGEIAPQYDLLNRVLSFGIDRRWRRCAVGRLALAPGQRLLDLCCGTGDLGFAFARHGVCLTGVDFTAPMLPIARAKAARRSIDCGLVQADAQSLPFATSSFDAVSIAFGIRNVEQPSTALQECLRVLQPGGKLAILEFFRIRNRLWRGVFRFYFHQVLPRIARFTKAGKTGAYEYLPASVDGFTNVDGFKVMLEEAGFIVVEDVALSGGVARLVVARKPGADEL